RRRHTRLVSDWSSDVCSSDLFRNKNECELVLFGVTSKLIGTGAGRLLMNRALQRAWAQPLTRLWVHTCSLDHPRALAFYQRCGRSEERRVGEEGRTSGTASD